MREYDELDDSKTLFKLGLKAGRLVDLKFELEKIERAGCAQVIDLHQTNFGSRDESLQVPPVALFHQ